MYVCYNNEIVTYMYGEHFRTSNIIVTTIPTKRMPKTAPITRGTFNSASGSVKKERESNEIIYVFHISVT